MQLRARVAIVTGAGSGIGRATAERLAREGARVVLGDISDEGGLETVRLIEADGGRAAFFHADVSVEADAKGLVAFAVSTFGALDMLVNNAGIVNDVAFPDTEPATWGRVLDVNLRGVMLCSHYAIEAMRAQGRGGAIVNIASGAGIGFAPHDAPEYAASKAGVVRFTASLAALRETDRIRVNCICPGWVETGMTRHTRSVMSEDEWLRIAPKVMLQPEEIADAVVYFIRNERHAGRVMLAYEGERRRLVPAPRTHERIRPPVDSG